MAFTDKSDGRIILAGDFPVKITLSGTVRTGDPVGYSSGWKAADGNNSIYAELVAGQHGGIGKVITCYRMARIGGITTGTAGSALYLSDTAGEYSASEGTVSQRLGFELGNGEMLIEPKDIVLVRANQFDWSDIEAVTGDVTISDSGVAAIGADKVTNVMLANIIRGSVKVGWGSNAPTDLVAKTDKQILIGDGTDIVSVALSGDIAITNAGAVSIVAQYMKVLTGSLASGNADAFAFAVQNPESAKILIHKVIIDITTVGGTGSSVLNVDVVGSATGTGDTIFDGIDLNAQAVLVNTNVSDSGTNGDEKVHKMDESGGTNDYITAKILVQNAASLVGKYYIFYTEVA